MFGFCRKQKKPKGTACMFVERGVQYRRSILKYASGYKRTYGTYIPRIVIICEVSVFVGAEHSFDDKPNPIGIVRRRSRY